MERVRAKIIFFIGWILSPFTSWNDSFINLPLAYVLASVHNYFFPGIFAAGIVAYYWLTNIVGIAMVYLGGREAFIKEFTGKRRLNLALTIILYSVIAGALSFKGVI